MFSLSTVLISNFDSLIRSNPPIRRKTSLVSFTLQAPAANLKNLEPFFLWRFKLFHTEFERRAFDWNSPPIAKSWFPKAWLVCQRGLFPMGETSLVNFIPMRPLRGWWMLLYSNFPPSLLSPRRRSCSSKRSMEKPWPPKAGKSTILWLHFWFLLKTSTSPLDEKIKATAGAQMKVLGAWDRLWQEAKKGEKEKLFFWCLKKLRKSFS